MINQDDIRAFLAKTIPDQIHLVAIIPDGPTNGQDFGIDAEAALKWAEEQNAQGKNVYFTVNQVKSGVNKKPTKADILGIRFAHVDIDPPKDGSDWDHKAARDRLMKAKPQPSFINWSGNGLQAFWRVNDATVIEIEEINCGLTDRFGGDKGTHNADRLMRLPGTMNYPTKKKAAAGREPASAFIVLKDDGSVCNVAELIAAFGTAPATPLQARQAVQTIALGNIEYVTANDLDLAADDYLRNLIDEPKGDDRSADVYACACEMGRRRYSRETVAGVLLNPENAVSAHCLDQPDPERSARRAINNAFSQDDVERRLRQREHTRLIGEGSDTVPPTTIFTLEEMLERFVFIKVGSQVADLRRPQVTQPFSDFVNTTAASFHRELKPDGGYKNVPCAKAWLAHYKRLDAETLTFRPGAPIITLSPSHAKTALNRWSPHTRADAPSDWADRAKPFIDHVRWLWGEYADDFFDWLAHLEQKPGDLPHFGWIHISRKTGKGRNWISSVLARLWAGNVAASLDLIGVLEGGFNDRLSRCLLAIVDEINEGGNSSYRHAQTLRRIVTEEHREINPKYGRRSIEYNSTRWLFFSNHTGAIPLGDNDRRFWVVDHDGPVREDTYYTALYGALHDPLFISSVAEFLRRRDISEFNVGMRPPITKAKAALIALTQSEDDTTLAQLAERWPVEIITGEELQRVLGHGTLGQPSTRHALDKAGLRKVGRLKTSTMSTTPAYAIRNHDFWGQCNSYARRAEIERIGCAAKEAALFDEDDWAAGDEFV